MTGPPPVLPRSSSTTSTSTSTTAARPAGRPRAATGVGAAFLPVAIAAGVILAVTLIAALASTLDPALGPGGRPHPTLHGNLREALDIFAGNSRLLILPLLLVAGRWPSGRVTRHLGDVIVGALVVVNPVTVGLALGRFGFALVPYLPHLPLEDAALAVAAAAWLSRRLPHLAGRPPGRALSYGVWTLGLTAVAALSETFLVPHAS